MRRRADEKNKLHKEQEVEADTPERERESEREINVHGDTQS